MKGIWIQKYRHGLIVTGRRVMALLWFTILEEQVDIWPHNVTVHMDVHLGHLGILTTAMQVVLARHEFSYKGVTKEL